MARLGRYLLHHWSVSGDVFPSTQMAHHQGRSLDPVGRSPGGIVVWANLKPVHITESIHISRAQ